MCIKCGKKGHYVVNCQGIPSKGNLENKPALLMHSNNKQTVALLEIEQSISNNLINFPLTINGYQAEAIIDMGATCLIISSKLAKLIPNLLLQSKNIFINSINKANAISSTGCTNDLQVEIDTQSFTHSFLVADTNESIPIICGLDLQTKLRINIANISASQKLFIVGLRTKS